MSDKKCKNKINNEKYKIKNCNKKNFTNMRKEKKEIKIVSVKNIK